MASSESLIVSDHDLEILPKVCPTDPIAQLIRNCVNVNNPKSVQTFTVLQYRLSELAALPKLNLQQQIDGLSLLFGLQSRTISQLRKKHLDELEKILAEHTGTITVDEGKPTQVTYTRDEIYYKLLPHLHTLYCEYGPEPKENLSAFVNKLRAQNSVPKGLDWPSVLRWIAVGFFLCLGLIKVIPGLSTLIFSAP